MLVAEAVGAGAGRGSASGTRSAWSAAATSTSPTRCVAAGVPFVAARHEGGAATMADAYARTTGAVGVLTVHQGCGLTNAMTGITEAAKSRTPLIVLARTPRRPRSAPTSASTRTRWSTAVGAVRRAVHTPAPAAADAVRAYRTAVEQRRTVVLNLPLDVQAASARGPAPTARGRPGRRRRSGAGGGRRRWPELLAAARRPVFVAGRGARTAGPRAARRSADASGALLATSAVAKGLFARQPVGLGHLRRLRHAAGRRADPRRRPGRGLGLRAQHVDHAPRHADRRRTPRSSRSTSTRTRSARTGRSTSAWSATSPRRARSRPRSAVVATAHGYRSAAVARGGSRPGAAGATCRTTTSPAPTGDRPAHAHDRAGRPAARGADRRRRLRQLHGLPERCTCRCPTRPGSASRRRSSRSGSGWRRRSARRSRGPDRLAVAALGDGGALMGVAELETVVRLGLPMVVVVYDDAATAPRCTTSPDGDPPPSRSPRSTSPRSGAATGSRP